MQLGDDGTVNLTTRLVNFPNDGQRLSDVWQSIARSVMNNTLVPALTAELVNSGKQHGMHAWHAHAEVHADAIMQLFSFKFMYMRV